MPPEIDRLSSSVRDCLAALEKWYATHDERPTLRDLADVLIASVSAVRNWLRVLERAGLARIPRGRHGGVLLVGASLQPTVRLDRGLFLVTIGGTAGACRINRLRLLAFRAALDAALEEYDRGGAWFGGGDAA